MTRAVVAAEREAMQAQITGLIGALTPRLRVTVELVYRDGLDTPPSSSASRITRAAAGQDAQPGVEPGRGDGGSGGRPVGHVDQPG